MSGQYLTAITENASRLGMRIQETISEHTRDLAIARGSAPYLDGPDDKNIRRHLDSSSDREKLDALKRLVALMSKGRNVSEYFAQVVKNVASSNMEIRKLVYIYLLKYAEQEPDLALLSINTFQRDLSDSNPFIRAMALRVLSGIKVPMIGNIVILAIKKCAADVSPYVRKSAALAIPKCYSLDANHLPALISIITTLLRDRSPLSIGSVAVAFEAVCPTRLDLLHQHYRRLCRILIDIDEWGQVDLTNLLLRYARVMLPRPVVDANALEIDSDVQLLLSSTEPLLQSRNPAVVMAATRVLYHAGPPSYWSKTVRPLLRLVNQSREVERVVLVYLLIMSRTKPELFVPYCARFSIRRDDFGQVKKVKIQLLMNLLTSDTSQVILCELIDCANDVDDTVVSESIIAIGKCAQSLPNCVPQCLSALTEMIKSPHGAVVSNAILVLKTLLQAQISDPSSTTATQNPMAIISRLARNIDDIRHTSARACIVWLVGQYAGTGEVLSRLRKVADWAPDVLRKLAKTFKEEASVVKLQCVVLASKLLVLSPEDHTLQLLTRYILNLGRYDQNYDVRDRARMMASLLSGICPDLTAPDATEERGGIVFRNEQIRLILFEGKTSAAETRLQRKGDDHLVIGSLSAVTEKSTLADSILPDWLEHGVESSLRDSDEDATPAAMTPPSALVLKANAAPVMPVSNTGSWSDPRNGTNKGGWTNLDDFYADTTEENLTSESEEGEAVEDEEGAEGGSGSGSEDDSSTEISQESSS